MSGQSARERLLDAVVAHFTAEGLADQSLRRIAEAIGSSHRMLLYHFGSKDGLLLASSARWRPGPRTGWPRSARTSRGETDDLVRRMWSYLSDPALGDFERLFFALYGRALQGDDAIRVAPATTTWSTGWTRTSPSRPARRAGGHGPGPRPPRAGRHPRPLARPARHGRPRGHRRAPSRPSPGATPGAGGSPRRRRPAPATGPRRGHGGRGPR